MTKVSKTKEPLISVIVPIYNVEKYLKKCIDSIINQTYKNLEIILVDDGSPDNCPKMCDEYKKKDKRIKVIHKENGGVSSARNDGLKCSNGDYISFIDADDWIDKSYFKKMYDAITKLNVDMVLCGYRRVTDKKTENIMKYSSIKILDKNEYIENVLNPQTGFGFCHMKLWKKELSKNVMFTPKLKVCEDALFNLQISNNIKKIAFLNDTIYNYRINGDSVVKKYDVNYPKKYLDGINEVKMYINDKFYSDQKISQCYYNFVAFHVLLIAVNYCYSKYNTGSKTKSLKKVCNIQVFKDGIKKSNYDKISLTRKITLFTIKKRLYWLTGIICKIRQMQNGVG